MAFCFDHININVLDLDRSIRFYADAFDLREMRRKEAADGSFTLVFLSDADGRFCIELTCLHDRKEPYELGDNETHLAFMTDDMEKAHARHEAMGCICFENHGMGIYFVEDPDGYWVEVIPPSE